MKKVTIIGAGIGGLTTAIALMKKGFEVEIFENTPVFKKAGSGINLAINAMQIFKRLGVYSDILAKGNYTNTINARSKDMQYLTKANFKNSEKVFGVKTVAIHRATLHEILLDHIGDTKIHLNKKLNRLEQNNGRVNLYFEDGTVHQAELVVGADGINSAVRRSIFPNSELRDAGQLCWRGISKIKINSEYKVELNELWGKGNRFGFVNISDDEVYWFGLMNKKNKTKAEVDLLALFSDFPEMIKDIIKQTPKEDIISNEIWDLKPMSQWYSGNICLVGDSCHATTPNMGQGAVQAIESAMAFSICLTEEATNQEAFARYQKLRQKKANKIVKASWLIGKIAQSDNAFICSIRNFVGRIVPNSIAAKQTKKMFHLNY